MNVNQQGPAMKNTQKPVAGAGKGKQEKRNRLMLTPDETGATMRARRKGFIGTVQTSKGILETDLYLFDEKSGVRKFCMGDVSYLDNRPNHKKFPDDVYRVYSMRALGLDGDDVLSLYYGGKRQTLRYTGKIPKRYVVHDKFVFRVKYDGKSNCWLYLNPLTNTFAALPFESKELMLCKEDLRTYCGDWPKKQKPAGVGARPVKSFGAQGAMPGPGLKSQQRPAARPTVMPEVIGAPMIGAPDFVNEDVADAPKLYELKVRYTDASGKTKGFGVIDPSGVKRKMLYNKVLQLAKNGEVKDVKVVDRGNGEFLQGVGQALESLPEKSV